MELWEIRKQGLEAAEAELRKKVLANFREELELGRIMLELSEEGAEGLPKIDTLRRDAMAQVANEGGRLDLIEFSEVLGITRSTIHRWRRERGLSSKRLPNPKTTDTTTEGARP